MGADEVSRLYNERLGHHYAYRELPNGQELVVVPLTFGRARLTIGTVGDWGYSDSW